MKSVKIIQYVALVVLTSFYLFPFEFVFLPGFNTKMIMAGIGLVLFVINNGRQRSLKLTREFASLIVCAMTISLVSLASMTINNTTDPSFLSYPVSSAVWLGGAYCLLCCIRLVHGDISVEIIVKYLVLVCVAQCVIAYEMTVIPALKNWVDSFLGGENAFMGKAEGRVYGIGAALDPSGQRFSAVLVMIAYYAMNPTNETSRKTLLLYAVAFLLISVIGNMMARSTTIGVVVSLFYILVVLFLRYRDRLPGRSFFIKTMVLTLVVSVPSIIYMYNTNANFHDNIRFAFEGFFSLAETGEWHTNSTDILTENMIVFPDNMHTWIIGDGYGANPYDIDPNYLGPDYHGFYMGTDIGYLRFIFYFGLFGMFSLIAYIVLCAFTCAERQPRYRMLYILILLVNMIGWAKVSTDIFLVFAIFLCLPPEE